MSELYKLPDGWEWKKLGDISKKIFAGGDKPEIVSEFKTDDLNIPIYANAVKDNGLYGYSNIYKVDEECITISARGTIGFTVVRNEKFLPIVRLIVVIPNEKVLSKILKYYLDYELVENTGSSIPQLTVPTVKELFFPLPPLEEQKRIVAKLDILFAKIDKAIALHQKNIDEANVFMASVLNDVFVELEEKYPKIIFDKVCNKITDGSHNPPKGIDNSQFMMLSSKNILNNSINFENPRYLKEEDFNRENKRTDVTIGDVLLTIVGTIGRTAVVNIEEKFTLQRSVAVLKPKKDLLNPYFLMYSLQKNLETLTDEAKGAAQKGIYLNSVKKLEIVDISLKTQQKVVLYLDEISQKMEKIKQIQKEKMESLKALKASILDQAFKGEL